VGVARPGGIAGNSTVRQGPGGIHLPWAVEVWGRAPARFAPMADRSIFQRSRRPCGRIGWGGLDPAGAGGGGGGVLLFNNISGRLAANSNRALGLGPGLSLTNPCPIGFALLLWFVGGRPGR